MSRSRLTFSLVALGFAALALIDTRVHGQTTGRVSRLLLDRIAPPPIERGVSPVETRVPGSDEMIRRRSIRSAGAQVDRIGSTGARYLPGRVIVKFKPGTSAETRGSVVSAVSRTASVSQPPSYADCDLVRIDANEDAEAVARSLAERGEVEYAQAAYRIYPSFTPNDALYPQQW